MLRFFNDDQFIALMDILSQAVILVNDEAVVVGINRAAADLFNLDKDAVIGRPVAGLGISSPLPRVLRERVRLEMRREHHGDKVLIANHLPLFRENVLVGAVSSYADVTTEDQLEQRLIRLKGAGRVLDAIMENSYDGIWVMNGQGEVLMVSKSWERFAGISREEMIGKSIFDIVKQGYQTDSAAIHAIRQRRPATIMYQTRTGKRALATSVPVFDEHGNIWRIISNIRDVTEMEELRAKLEEAESTARRSEEELRLLRKAVFDGGEMVAQSKAMHELTELVAQVARADASVLLLGESGVGKDVIARLIHKLSPRCEGPFLKINCGAIPEHLIESELFGYEEGSFTGARKKGKLGMFELANKGTLFLDEIGEIPLALQPKLLQALEDRRIMRVGGTKPVELDVRVIAATNRDLKEMVDQNLFRADLYYRLNVIPVTIPPLRERPEDITPLAQHFLQHFNEKYGLKKTLSPGAISALNRYHWPGNVRELKHVIERTVVTTPGDTIRAGQLPPAIRGESGEKRPPGLPSLKQAREELEKKLITEALARYGSTHKAAAALGVAQPTIVRKAQKYKICLSDAKVHH